MKQLTKIKKANTSIKSHYKEIKKLEEKIDKLRESVKYKMVQKGIEFSEDRLGSMSVYPKEENHRVLCIRTNRDWNSIYGIKLRYSSVVKFRNYLNDFLKTRPNAK